MQAIRKTRGFTLVEILIVVIILGILAAIVIPQFTNASEDARKNSMASTLQSLRSQLAVYKLEHSSDWPASADLWTQLTTKTDINGVASADPSAKGPYFEAEVKNPITGSSTIVAGDHTAAVTANDGWVYDATTGALHGVAKDPENPGSYMVSDDGVTKFEPADAAAAG